MEIAKKLVAIQQELKELGAITARIEADGHIEVLMFDGSIKDLNINYEIETSYKNDKYIRLVGESNGIKFVEVVRKNEIDKHYAHLKEAKDATQ